MRVTGARARLEQDHIRSQSRRTQSQRRSPSLAYLAYLTLL